MAYIPNTWVVGDVITADKLNALEQAVADNSQKSSYDAEITIYHDGNSSHEYEFTIVSGSYAELYEMLSNNKVPSVLVRVFDDFAAVHAATPLVSFYGWTDEGITFFIKASKAVSTGTYINEWYTWSYLWWSNEDQISMD